MITKGSLAAAVPGYESDMPAFEAPLPDEEIRAVLAFIKSTWPDREREYQEARTRTEMRGVMLTARASGHSTGGGPVLLTFPWRNSQTRLRPQYGAPSEKDSTP